MAPFRVTVGDMAIMIPVSFLSASLYWHRTTYERTWLRLQRAAHSQLHCQDGIAIPVTDSVATAIECAHIILCSRDPSEMTGRGSSPRHLGRRSLARYQWLLW